MGTEGNRNIGKSRDNTKKHLTMGITRSDSPQEKCTRRTTQKENVCRLQKNQPTTTRGYQCRWWKRMHLTHSPTKNRRTVCQIERIQSFLKPRSQIRILPYWPNKFGKAQIIIHLIILRQIPVQQSSIRTRTGTSIFPETDKRCTKRMQLRNGIFRRHYHLQQIRTRTSRTLRGNIH